ncbi:MAG: DUF4373 domain-containing protein [Pseudoramibacter sp.]
MARKHKDKVDYFPLDVVMDTDVRLLDIRFGLAGYAVFIKLYQYIYGQHGYYGEWDADAKLLFCSDQNIREDERALVDEVTDWCLDRGLFSREIYEKYEILTSHGIQAQFLRITKKRAETKIDERFDLVHQDVGKTEASVDKIGITSRRNTQRKQKQKDKLKPKGKLKLIQKEKDLAPETGAGGSDEPRERVLMISDYWNHHVAEPCGLSKIRAPEHWSDQRRGLLKARVLAEGERGVLDVFDRVCASDFLTGRTGGKWQADFDWVLKAENFQKIAEGRYDNPKQASSESYYDKIIKGGIE